MPEPVLLWLDGVPGALGDRSEDNPKVIPYLAPADSATGAAVVILPGGGYGVLAPHEGAVYAQFLNTLGVHGFVVEYRLAPNGYRHPCMWQDATRSTRLVRFKAKEWGVDPNRIGIMGSSAGRHLASTLLVHWDEGDPSSIDPIERQSSRPDLGILCYPVITMQEATHEGSRANLLGESPTLEQLDFRSCEKHVNGRNPPCFLMHTAEDRGVSPLNSIRFAQALAEHDVFFELHVYGKGHHGIGLWCNEFDPTRIHPWTAELRRWLIDRGFANP